MFLHKSNPMRTESAQTEMPRYQCHKKVWALKINRITLDSDLAETEDRVSLSKHQSEE